MSDTPAFFSERFGRTGLTPTVGLGIPLYVIRATFIHPITNVATSLPPHHWVLFEERGNSVVSLSRASDASGVCVINDVADPGPATLVLAFVPAPTDIRNAFLDTGEAWIDLDKNDWATPQPDRSKIDRRNLYRIPAWTTTRKATRGGGFKDWPTNARPDNREGGFLSREDVLHHPYGSLARPWDMAIDFGWTRATVRYFYFDWGRDKQNVLPPGLFVDVMPSVHGGGVERLGSGTAVTDATGAARILIEGAPWVWSGAHIEFRAPPESRVDLAAPEPAGGAKDTRLTADGPCPADGHAKNRLPTQWHSLGQRCKATLKSSGKVLGRASWFEVSAQLSREGSAAEDVTIDFHLDDVALRNGDGTVTNLNGRPALFDHFLAILDPVAGRPHQSDTTVDQSVLAADKVFTIGKALPSGRKRLEASTRLVHIEGKLFDLRDGRVQGTPGRTANLGARAAFHNHHPHVSLKDGNPFLEKRGFYELHLVDVPAVLDPSSKKQLMHMLLFVSCEVDENGLPGPVVSDFHKMLAKAAERWSQGSPGIIEATKDYRIVAKDLAKRENLVIRTRAYFGQASSGAIMKIVLERGDSTSRSNTAGAIWFLLSPKLTYFEPDIATDVAGSAGSVADSDGVSAAWHTLAHEFGHVFGLPDEYGEDLDPKSVDPKAPTRNPRVLAYSQPKEGMPTDFRPFYSDGNAIMKQNQLPRLRHLWHHVEVLNTSDAFRSLPDRPYLLRHETLGSGGIEYLRPNDDHAHPYRALFADKPIPGLAKGRCALFPVGQDEGVAEGIFAAADSSAAATLPVASRFDGILVIRARVGFRFDTTVVPDERWKVIAEKFIQKLYDERHRERVRFALHGGTKLSRIAILLQPHCAVGRDFLSDDDITLELSSRSPPPPNPFAAGTTSSVKLDVLHFDANCLLRMILGTQTMRSNPPGPPIANTLPLVASEFDNIAKLVDRELGDPYGTRVVISV